MAQEIQRYIIGATPKFAINITPFKGSSHDGEAENTVHLKDMQFSVFFYTKPNKQVEYPKEKLTQESEDCYLVVVDTNDMDAGQLYCRVVLHVGDDDAPSGERIEILQLATGVQLVK